MIIRNRSVRWLTAIVLALVAMSQFSAPAQNRRELNVPNIPGYVTLQCDFHLHTVFSDGLVWPTVRVDEAWREGLHAISITDHIEYLPHRNDVIPNHERPYEIALPQAERRNILLIKGTEITRDTPPGHFNALFLKEVDPLDTPDFMDVMNQAREQKAFVFWNHPGWKANDGESYVFDIHEELFQKGLIQGLEVVNGGSYYKEGHQWALDKNLTLIGTTDAHQPIAPLTGKDHRSMTLVFAQERSIEGIREALFSGRTAVWFRNQIIGRAAVLEPLIEASVVIHEPAEISGNQAQVKVENRSDLPFSFRRISGGGPEQVDLPAGGTITTQVELGAGGSAELEYEVTNLLVAPEQGLQVRFSLP